MSNTSNDFAVRGYRRLVQQPTVIVPVFFASFLNYWIEHLNYHSYYYNKQRIINNKTTFEKLEEAFVALIVGKVQSSPDRFKEYVNYIQRYSSHIICNVPSILLVCKMYVIFCLY